MDFQLLWMSVLDLLQTKSQQRRPTPLQPHAPVPVERALTPPIRDVIGLVSVVAVLDENVTSGGREQLSPVRCVVELRAAVKLETVVAIVGDCLGAGLVDSVDKCSIASTQALR